MTRALVLLYWLKSNREQPGNDIGGATRFSRNVISGNNHEGIRSEGHESLIQGNYIGVARDGVTSLPNDSNGILLQGAATGNVVGGLAASEANLIANNIDAGVNIRDAYANRNRRALADTDANGDGWALPNAGGDVTAGGQS